MAASPIVERVTALVLPICADLGLELYDCEFAGGQLTITLDKAADSPVVEPVEPHEEAAESATDASSGERRQGITLDSLALATRLISRELDHADPIPGHYTLEVTSPGLERALRTPAHFQRAVGSDVAIRLRDVTNDERRVHGVLTAADDATATVTLPDGSTRTVAYEQVDRARTVFTWGPPPKPVRGRGAGKSAKSTSKGKPSGRGPSAEVTPSEKAEAPS